MEITISKIESLAPNADAAKKGRELVTKNKFTDLKIDQDKTLIWGACAGSGKNPYYCSGDFVEPNNPVFRCNCPSRQFPCKHSIGLMYAFEKGSTFDVAEIPQDIADKRNKIEKKSEKKDQEIASLKDKAAVPKKINKAAATKKIDAQLLGIEMANKMLQNFVQNGLSSIDAKEIKNIESQIKELGNYYIPGIQTEFSNFILELRAVENESYTNVINQINFLSTLLKKANTYLNERKETPDAAPEITSNLEEQIGTIWKLTDLIQQGLWEEDANLIQLSFNSYDHLARKEYVDEGSWLNLKSGKIYKTKNYRPYKASKYIKEENSESAIALLKELYVYPGDLNPRIRWEQSAKSERPITSEDIATIHSLASKNYAELWKQIKNSIKNPLNDKNPIVLIALHKAILMDEYLVISDQEGNQVTLSNISEFELPTATTLQAILPAENNNTSLVAMVNNDVATGLFTLYPMSLITENKIIKLLF